MTKERFTYLLESFSHKRAVLLEEFEKLSTRLSEAKEKGLDCSEIMIEITNNFSSRLDLMEQYTQAVEEYYGKKGD